MLAIVTKLSILDVCGVLATLLQTKACAQKVLKTHLARFWLSCASNVRLGSKYASVEWKVFLMKTSIKLLYHNGLLQGNLRCFWRFSTFDNSDNHINSNPVWNQYFFQLSLSVFAEKQRWWNFCWGVVDLRWSE